MSNTKISLYDLYEIKKKKDNKVNEAFNIILNACNKKIKTIAELGGQSLYYNIPPIIIGYPLYNYKNCITYIIKSLQKTDYMYLYYLIIIPSIYHGKLKMFQFNHLKKIYYYINYYHYHYHYYHYHYHYYYYYYHYYLFF